MPENEEPTQLYEIGTSENPEPEAASTVEYQTADRSSTISINSLT